MKTFTAILIVVIAAAAVHAGGHDKMKKNAEECKAKVHATDDDLKALKNFSTPSTKTGQCLLACLQKKNGWMNADNTINVDVASKFFEHFKDKEPEKYKKIIEKLKTCKAQEKKEADECVAAKNFSNCMHPPKKN